MLGWGVESTIVRRAAALCGHVHKHKLMVSFTWCTEVSIQVGLNAGIVLRIGGQNKLRALGTLSNNHRPLKILKTT